MIGAIILKTALDLTGTNQMNKRDIDKLMSHWTEDAVLIYPGNMPVSRKIQGKPMIRAFFEIYFEQFPEFNFSSNHNFIKNMFALGMTNTVATEVSVKYTNRFGKTFENSVMSVLKIKRGRILYDKDYYFDVAALNEAWEGADYSRIESFLKQSP